MDERTTEIVREIAEERQRLANDVAQLEQKVRAATDWRKYFAKKPWAMLGLAAAAGFVLSGLFTGRPRSASCGI